MKKILIATGFLLAASSATSSVASAQGYIYGAPHGYRNYYYAPGYGAYDYAPGIYDYAPGAFGGDPYGWDRVDGPGRGNSAESQR